jgi:hypothetical protein
MMVDSHADSLEAARRVIRCRDALWLLRVG